MTDETIIWGKWDCSNCRATGLSAEPAAGESQPKCPHCGSPRSDAEGETPYLDSEIDPETGEVLNPNLADTDEELAIARAGADWNCKFCRADNRAGRETCVGCGAPRSEADPVPDRPALRLKGINPPPGGELSASTTSPSVEPKRGYIAGCLHRFLQIIIGIGIIAAAAIVGMQYWISQRAKISREIEGTVSAIHWTHTSHLQRFQPVVLEGWRSDLRPADAVMPINGTGEIAGVADVRECLNKFHHSERYECGITYVCHTETRRVRKGENCSRQCSQKSNKNGSFTQSCRDVCTPTYSNESYQRCGNETQYCNRPISQSWCKYDSHKWDEIESKTESGDSVQTSWGQFEPGTLDRITKEEQYDVKIDFPGLKAREYHVQPGSESEFKKWQKGDKVLVVENGLGVIKKIVPAGEIESYRNAQEQQVLPK